MSEFSVSQVDAHMGHFTFAQGVEEYEVSRFQLALGHRGTLLVLSGRDAGKIDAHFLEHVSCKSGTVKTVGRDASIFVRCSVHGFNDAGQCGVRKGTSCPHGEQNS